jgi:hypothetical protein
MQFDLSAAVVFTKTSDFNNMIHCSNNFSIASDYVTVEIWGGQTTACEPDEAREESVRSATLSRYY